MNKYFSGLLTTFFIIFISMSANSDGHINLKYFATAKLYLEPNMMMVGDREPLVNVDKEESYIETADGARWEALNPCADWLVLQESGVFNLDVRCTAKAEDGSIVRIDYIGRAYPHDTGAEKMGAGDLIKAEDMYFRTAPTMKTLSEKYSWINTTMFVGEMVELQFFNENGKRPYVMYKWYAVQ